MDATSAGQNLSNNQAEELLFLILIAVTEYGGTSRITSLEEFVEDVTQSMEPTTDRADSLYKEIMENLV
jgi:tetrahydromethanopterin S-methyltransferase subunit B